jgi:dsDNA-binding SOS-regulon protein
MPQKKDDLDKISEVLLEFFKTQRIVDSLDAIHKYELSGWEKWWQTELALFLAHADHLISEWDMEHPFDTDKRTRLSQSRMALDIGFRLKRHSKDEWHFIELKQANEYKKCIDRMASDANKVFSARKHSFDGLKVRYIACAGTFLTEKNEDKVLDYAEQALDKLDIPIDDGFFIEKVGKYHSMLIF